MKIDGFNYCFCFNRCYNCDVKFSYCTQSLVLQGQELHDKLTNPRGLVIKSSILLDKAKLEEEVKRLHLKITDSLSAQHTEIGKWKNRAIKLKARSKHEVDNFLCSPKRFLVTPRNLLDSPRNVSLLHSPKSRFFDVGGTSELLSQSCPRQFFDNSSLGTIPDNSGYGLVINTLARSLSIFWRLSCCLVTCAHKDVSRGADRKSSGQCLNISGITGVVLTEARGDGVLLFSFEFT
uniref:Uncharacterized protein n=1 Tax=Scophthalmus maximus TaxID=52904 RepID=A0A8D3C6F7_SCOMX